MTRNSIIVSSWIEAELAEKIDRAAEECDQSRSAFLKTMIEEHIDENPRDLNALKQQSDQQTDELDSSDHDDVPTSFVDEMLNDFE